MAAMAVQSRRAATARPTYLVTTPLEMPKAVAICWCDCWPSNLRRKASLSLRMLILGAGIAVLQKGLTLTRPKYEIHAQHRADVVDRRTGHDDRNGRSRSRNQRSRSTGITGHVAPEYALRTRDSSVTTRTVAEFSAVRWPATSRCAPHCPRSRPDRCCPALESGWCRLGPSGRFGSVTGESPFWCC